MSKPKKQPRPAGFGNYRVCGDCNGYGVIVEGKKYTGKKYPAPKNTMDLILRCKTCYGRGWTPAK